MVEPVKQPMEEKTCDMSTSSPSPDANPNQPPLPPPLKVAGSGWVVLARNDGAIRLRLSRSNIRLRPIPSKQEWQARKSIEQEQQQQKQRSSQCTCKCTCLSSDAQAVSEHMSRIKNRLTQTEEPPKKKKIRVRLCDTKHLSEKERDALRVLSGEPPKTPPIEKTKPVKKTLYKMGIGANISHRPYIADGALVLSHA